MTLSCEDIYSAFLGLIDDYQIPHMSIDEAYEYMEECFKNVFSKPKIRRLFSSISYDSNTLKLDCKLRNSIDNEYDEEFVKGLFANGMVVAWLEPRYQSETLTAQFFAGKEQKFYAQSSHMAELEKMYIHAKSVVDKDYSRDHGYSALLLNGGAS